jgi:hypothetical protein
VRCAGLDPTALGQWAADQRGERTFASTERPARDKQPDPNSPFAKLLALKAELENKGKKD